MLTRCKKESGTGENGKGWFRRGDREGRRGKLKYFFKNLYLWLNLYQYRLVKDVGSDEVSAADVANYHQ